MERNRRATRIYHGDRRQYGCLDRTLRFEPNSKRFHLEAEIGSQTYGILSNRYLHDSYKTKRYVLDVTIHDDGKFSYIEDTQLWIPVKQEIFHHTDQNTLTKVCAAAWTLSIHGSRKEG